MSFVSGPSQWRFPISFQAFFAICLVLQMLPLPETPRFLIETGRNDEAALVLARLEGTDDVDSEEIKFQRHQIETSIEIESAGGPFRYKELFTGGKLQNFRRIILCGVVEIMQQFTGANMVCQEIRRKPLNALRADGMIRSTTTRLLSTQTQWVSPAICH